MGRWLDKVKNIYDKICEIKPHDSSETIALKNEMKKLFEQQDKLEIKYKCVRDYAKLGYKINMIKQEIEELME